MDVGFRAGMQVKKILEPEKTLTYKDYKNMRNRPGAFLPLWGTERSGEYCKKRTTVNRLLEL